MKKIKVQKRPLSYGEILDQKRIKKHKITLGPKKTNKKT